MHTIPVVFRWVVPAVLSLSTIFAPAYAGNSPDSYESARDQYIKQRAAAPADQQFTEEERALMQRSAQDLAERLPEPGLKVGEPAPDFTLPNAFGQQVSLYEQLENGPVVLVFYRGAWCPFCNMHLQALSNYLPEMRKLGARLLLVTPQKPDKSRHQLEDRGYPFEVLSDLDSSVMRDYRLYFELDSELMSLYRSKGLDIIDYNGPGRNVLPVPGTLVIDGDGIVRAVHADVDYKERMEPADIVAALQDLQR